MNESQAGKGSQVGVFQMALLAFTIIVLCALVTDTVLTLPKEVTDLIHIADTFACAVFFVDFCIRFYQAESKAAFMKWGWIDLISSIPNMDLLRAGRTLRLIRILRILRAFRSTKHLLTHVFQNKAKGAFTTVSALAIILIIFSSVSILQFEDAPNSNIKTAEDAIWWSYVTITTVGYGDKFPVTTGGRIVAAILMTAGVGLFGTFTAFVSSWFLTDKKGEGIK